MRKLLLVIILSLSCALVNSQDTDSLYRYADSFRGRFADKFLYNVTDVRPVDGSHSFWYATTTENGGEYLMVDPESKLVKPLFDQHRLAAALSEISGRDVEPYKLGIRNVRYEPAKNEIGFVHEGVNYKCGLTDYLPVKDETPTRPWGGYWGSVDRERSDAKVKSPDGTKEAFIREGNIWIQHTDGSVGQLSYDGAVDEYYSARIEWSPDSKYLVSSKCRPANVRKLLLISSSPSDQLQPKTEEYDYPKPSDALMLRRPVLFNVEAGKTIPLEFPSMEEQFDLGRYRWDPQSRFFTFNFNRRGHQQYTIYKVEVPDGKITPLVDERSETFIYYNVLYTHWMENSDELLWISERDGWRHIYLYDTEKCSVKKQVTSGQWVVKSVSHVDEKNRRIIFVGCGKDQGEDPYLEKYYSVDIDKGTVKCLTPENGNHTVVFSDDYKVMSDCYSRVDMAPVWVLRSVEDGKILYQPERQPDITRALEAGWRVPEVFCAKGRDGKTDIWGVIIRPTDFDPSKKYPVIEYIYAGPHDSHVPKSFTLNHRTSELSEIGFITVMIDGMGTANRSKEFHDVCWQNLKDAGFPDRIAWMKAAGEIYPEMDLDRVGIYGGSAGGQNSMGALLFHPDFYKVAVAACGCYDNRMDKIWWNEQWMGYPVGPHYEESSNVVNAHLLQGKLMLILGELDNNVDPSSTLQVVDALIKHDKEFEFVMLPNARHTLGEAYGERKRRDFFVKHLLGKELPDWNRKTDR